MTRRPLPARRLTGASVAALRPRGSWIAALLGALALLTFAPVATLLGFPQWHFLESGVASITAWPRFQLIGRSQRCSH